MSFSVTEPTKATKWFAGVLVAGYALITIVPLIWIIGTCMNAGKTFAACAIVRALHKAGYKVGGAKLTGISLQNNR